jgi:hypothetical protein
MVCSTYHRRLASRLGAHFQRPTKFALDIRRRPLRVEPLEDRRLLSITVDTSLDEFGGDKWWDSYQ